MNLHATNSLLSHLMVNFIFSTQIRILQSSYNVVQVYLKHLLFTAFISIT